MKLIKLERALYLSAVSRSTFYNNIKLGLMTPPVSLGIHSVAWPEHEINAINSARVAAKSEYEIKALVAQLVTARKELNLSDVLNG